MMSWRTVCDFKWIHSTINRTNPTPRKAPVYRTLRFDPIAAVKVSPCKLGGTIKQCPSRRRSVSAIQGLGWSSRKTAAGYVVERGAQAAGVSSRTNFQWTVTRRGVLGPTNDYPPRFTSRHRTGH